MAFGGGKYEPEAEAALKTTNADLIGVFVVGGNRGDGFALQVKAPSGLLALAKLPEILRTIAEQVENDLRSPVARRRESK